MLSLRGMSSGPTPLSADTSSYDKVLRILILTNLHVQAHENLSQPLPRLALGPWHGHT